MRISTALMYTQGVNAIGRQQSELLQSQQQIASGRRVLTPADDPVAAAQALTVAQARDRNVQHASNIDTAKTALSFNDSVLAQMSEVLQSARTSAIDGGNGVLANSDRMTIAADTSARLQELVGLANSKDGNGHYLFSGFQSDTMPFADSGNGIVVYQGDQGVRELRVSSGRVLSLGESGSTIFEQVKNGNGTIVTQVSGTNTGTGVIAAGQVVVPAAFTGDSYSIAFHVSAGVTTYDLVDATTAATISTGHAYTDGAAITVGGIQSSVGGAPADGDTFAVAPSAQQSIFKTLQRLITTLQTPIATPADRAQLASGLGRALQDIDQALDHVLASRTRVGATLRELDSITSANEERGLQYAQSLSALQDLDYNKALSDFARQQLALDAAQKSFAKISGLSLFNYL